MSTATDRARIAARYPQPRRPWLIWVIAAVVLPLLGFWLWISTVKANPPLTASVTSFVVTGPNAMEVELMIDRSRPEVSGRCLVQASAHGGEKVGEIWYAVRPAGAEVTRERTSLRTFRPPESAAVSQCVAE
ncbi:DUF4307 domain-containing protein [Enemella dayhoffiae]|nr:DUF4307 domain-containing protein [Enemella dayhoffiae]